MDVVVMANTVHGYMSQSDKGEMVIGGGADGYNNYTQRGSFHHVEETVRALVETFPIIAAQDAALVGRHRRHDGRPLADHLEDARWKAASSTAAGAPAASRRSPARAGPWRN
jgi:glycine/D-amino acid oxidase-like deaminating enzyme